MFGSEDEDCDSEPGSWAYEEDVPLDLSEGEGDSSLTLEDVISEVIIQLGDKVACYSSAPRHVELNLDLENMPATLRQAVGLADTGVVSIGLDFDSINFGAGSTPRCSVNHNSIETSLTAAAQQSLNDSTQQNQQKSSQSPPVKPRLLRIAQEPEADNQNQEASIAPEQQSDSETEVSPASNKRRQVLTPVQFQLTQIVTRKIAAQWPQMRLARFSEAKKWFIDLHDYFSHRLRRLGDVCVYCDDPQPVAGPKPVACEKLLCRYQVDELGCGASMSAIYQQPLVADLLISLATMAAGNPNQKHRQRFFACPYPPSDFVCQKTWSTNAANADDNMGIQWTELIKVLSDLPSVAKMAAAKNLKRFLDKHDPRAFRLVRWVLSTCRVHIVQLQADEQVEEMGGYQFKLFTNTFEREIAFQTLKRQYGSSYAFHGSKFMNWHSILRTSLQNFSNTQYMLNGATYGSGVYVSPNASTSSAYSRSHYGMSGSSSTHYKGSVFGADPACLSVAEVAKIPSNVNNGNVQVVKDHNAVVARYLFVFGLNTMMPTAASIDRMNIPLWEDVVI